MSSSSTQREPIAIVGTGCRFSGGANNPSKLWNLLNEPRDIRRIIPESRFNANAFYHADASTHGHTNVKHSYIFEEDPTTFDAEFFGINNIEARAMDPQHRVLLETVYEAVEAAGYTMEGLRGSDTSVFAGVMCGDYEAMLLRDLDAAPTYFAVGTSRAVLANRISYFFDWHGASVTMDTACSSSLVAVHMAMQALRAGESRVAVACGSNIILGPEMYIVESKVKMLSPDGLGRMWDKDANGYARGEGVGAIVLKTLSAALADNDHIECIIRETGLNQDGTTPGLTMPSATAQEALIKTTYAKAGLDLKSVADRPQFFEAHGTGTPAGDPVEAEAISRAFFEEDFDKATNLSTLLVGSIKTILGHTEGTAGVAAILKASLALQRGRIPPNMLFNNLSPSVAPFYQNLDIPTISQPWPNVDQSHVRRASVNSFGFGGTNAHAILESYDAPKTTSLAAEEVPSFTPFVFSAATSGALRDLLKEYAEYLTSNENVNLRDLAYTLRDRRSVLAQRISFAAATAGELKDLLIAATQSDDGSALGVRNSHRTATKSRVLGIFTGQGAQYAGMGAELIQQSQFASDALSQLDEYLTELPEEDRPAWSLRKELLATQFESRLNEAAISQPLCTAVQIILVQLYRAAKAPLNTVIGHSSGEIAAAYAAGYLSARDAMYVAYYRGLYCRLSASPNGATQGAMLAVGTSPEDSRQLIEDDEFKGRLEIAAENSASSVTISGDVDAIEELEIILDDEKKFNRRLKVDQAYHSRHMDPCAVSYAAALKRVNIKVDLSPGTGCTWMSSVYAGKTAEDVLSDLAGSYWIANMTQTVMFRQALTNALAAGPYDAVVEFGPHAALKGPANQTITEILNHSLPYTGTLTRASGARKAVAHALGFLWSTTSVGSISLTGVEAALSGGQIPGQVLKDLPTYPWNHATRYWHESRRSRHMRLRSLPFHPLLGDVSPESGPHARRWRNILKPSELPWMEGHQVQGQIVLPASAYVCTALEAAQHLTDPEMIKLVELQDFHIHQAVTFEDTNAGIEIFVELLQISRSSDQSITAYFSYSAALGTDATDLTLAANSEIKIHLGERSKSYLPLRGSIPPHLIPVEEGRLYGFMESLEYNFTQEFRSLETLSRKLGHAACVSRKASTPDADLVMLHPVDLDAGFQSVMLAYSYPGDDQLRTLHLPTSISKIRFNPAVLDSQGNDARNFFIDAMCTPEDRSTPGSGFSGSINMFTTGSEHAAIQVDGIEFKPVGAAASEDRNVFYKIDYISAQPDGLAATESIPITSRDTDLLWVLCRIATFYMRMFNRDIPEDHAARTESPLCHYLSYARHMSNLFDRGEHKYARKEWEHDTLEDIIRDIDHHGFGQNSDVRIMRLVGETMPQVFKGETTMLEKFRESGLLDEYYAHGFGTLQSSTWLSNSVRQLSECHPHLNIMEIGAGTGGATKSILRSIDQDFDSYTFTDISSSFFENAAEALAPWRDRLIFKVFDAERDPATQGFQEGAWDVVIAYMVLHATAKIDETMRNLRKLVKPGGYILVGEQSSEGASEAGAGFIFGPLPGWWRGVEEGRTLSPLLSVSQWDETLKRTGFSGIDTISPPKFLETFGVALFVSQAVDSRVELIRNPLTTVQSPFCKQLLVIGGHESKNAQLVDQLYSILQPLAGQTKLRKRLVDVADEDLQDGVTVLSLADLDCAAFKDITPSRWTGFKRFFQGQKTILWVTSRNSDTEGYSNMSVGFGRSAKHEEEGLRLQYLDIPDSRTISPDSIASALVRFASIAHIGDDILHTIEPEIAIDNQGKLLVPRINPIVGANLRMNCLARHISHEVDLNTSVVELQHTSGRWSFRELSRFELMDTTTAAGLLDLKVDRSTLYAIKSPTGFHHVITGLDSTGARRLALVPTVSSKLRIAESSTLLCNAACEEGKAFVAGAAAELTSIAVLDHLRSGEHILVHNTTEDTAAYISSRASSSGIQVTFTTSRVDTAVPSAWVKLSFYLSRSEVKQLIPTNIAAFVSLSDQQSEIEKTIISLLPRHCRIQESSDLYSTSGYDGPHAALHTLQQCLSEISSFKNRGLVHKDTEVLNLEALADSQTPRSTSALVQWETALSLACRVSRFDLKPLFKQDKTYWLCGLSGALGISLCDWMIDRGVRHLVLTSRNPKVDPVWIENHRLNGVTVKTMSCDVTDEAALRKVHKSIVDSMPPITGVLNGAMVLRDTSVANMEYDQVTDVIRPKVLGSIHLDRIFENIDLDFFILLSSINCVIGNVGQANYAAANTGMCGVATNRRKRGLASSVVNVGAIIGVGYITQSDRQLDVTVAKTAMMHLSEEDFHQIFAEAMEAGHPSCTYGPEISTGILSIAPDAKYIPQWYTDPKFSRFKIHQTSRQLGAKEQSGGASMQESLKECTTKEDVSKVISEAFGAQLRRVLQVSTPTEELLAMCSLDLGLDSLISVDIRSWFLKNLQVSIPVLKIMANNAQMGELVDIAVADVPGELIPACVDSSPGQSESLTASSPQMSATSHSSGSEGTLTSNTDHSDAGTNQLDSVDWDAETKPIVEVVPSTTNRAAPRIDPEVVLLTGCSGLLGRHLLNALVSQASIKKVICIAVRNLNDRIKAKQLPMPDSRVIYYEGDLSAHRFGLAEAEQTAIFDEVDAVIHNGSDTSHLKYYSALKQTNVASTKQLVALCLGRMVPIHYVSSAGVALFSGLDPFPEISATLTDARPPADGSHGYMCGKWVCEKFLEGVSQASGLRVTIQRPSTIIRAGEDATTARANFDWVNALLHYSHKIKTVPKVQHNTGAFDLVQVETCVKDIMRELRSPRGAPVTYVNNVGDAVIPMTRMAELGLQSAEMRLYREVGIREWAQLAIAAGLHPAVAALIETFDEQGSAKYPLLSRSRK